MSLSFRPVREEWGEACSCFIDADEVVRLLRRVADVLEIPSDTTTTQTTSACGSRTE